MSRLRLRGGPRLGILAPVLDLPVLVDMRGHPGGLGIDLAGVDGQRQQRRAGEAVIRCSAASRNGSARWRR